MSRIPIVINKEASLERLENQPEYLGIAEVALVLDIKKQVVVSWTNKKRLPEPYAKLAMGAIWSKDSIRDFITNQPLPDDAVPATETSTEIVHTQ